MRKVTAKTCGCCFLLLVLAACAPEHLAKYIPPEGKYDVRILRDTWGVPHIFGKTDADVAYGLAYANCEDDWTNLEDAVLVTRSRLASARGKDWAKFDYIVQFFRIREFVDEKYEKELSPELRTLLEAYADGVNHYAALHRKKVPYMPLPVTGKDIVAGSALKSPFFYGLQDDLETLFGKSEGASIGKKGLDIAAALSENPFTNGLPIGSNAWGVSPARSADGATRININSHMPWEGPVTFFEAHLHSEEGWNMTGGTFPGGPMIFLGHDENKGWSHTINRPDLADIYELEINPDNKNQYKFDGEWRDLEQGVARIKVRLWGPIAWTFKEEMLWSVYGPTVRRDDGKVYSIRFAGLGEVGQLEQWYRMNKARNLEEFLDAMRMVKLTSLNTLYADKDGNLFYMYNGQFPVRAEGYDWKGILPGNTSKTLWTEKVPFEKLPQVLHPASGFVQTCNSSPFYATDGEGNPRAEDFPEWMGIETHQTNRCRRALELYGPDPSITAEEFRAYKFDKTYSTESSIVKFLDKLFALDEPQDPVLQEGLKLLKGWNRTTTKDNTAASLAILCSENKNNDDPMATLRKATGILMKHYGKLDISWSEMTRLRRGVTDLGLGGAPDCLRAVDVVLEDDGHFVGVNGDCYILLAEWDKDGNVKSESIHQYGTGTTDTKSPHYADQAPLFVDEKTKPTLLTEEAVRANLKKEYRPGESGDPWYAE